MPLTVTFAPGETEKEVAVIDTIDRSLTDGTLYMEYVQVNASSATRSEIVQIAEIFQARVVDVDKRTLTIEMAASPGKLVALQEMLQPFGIIEVVRTGTVAIARG
jgi:acetolactate synthase small subunit